MASYQEWRAAELRGAAAARVVHDRLGLRDGLRDGTQPVDIFAAIQQRRRTLLFQPLDTLLGAYIRHGEISGLVVTTKRDLHIQRFTAAHELGHAELDHPATSLDKEVGFAARGPTPRSNDSHSIHEIEADAFASEFLLPKWLIAAHVRRRGWSKSDLLKADVVYQLSLRLGASYTATCWSLSANAVVSRRDAEALAAVAPKTSKQRALAGFKPDSWRDTDVWLLRVTDSGTQVLGDPHDKLVLDLEEHAAGGYVWDLEDAVPGLQVERVGRNNIRESSDEVVGGPSRRRLLLSGGIYGRVRFVERRPWDDSSAELNSFVLDLDLRGPEAPGLPRAARHALQ
jgi:Zn-dependent peptidase ImmA (M78 family)